MNPTLAKSQQVVLKSLSHWSSSLVMILAAACWGAGTVMSKGILGYIPPLTLLVVQLVASLTFLWTVVALQRIHIPLRRQMLWLALMGLLNPGLAYSFSLLGLWLTTASMSALLWAAEPLLILGLAWFILRERLTRSLLACSLLALVGVVLVIGIDASTGNGGSLVGNLLILAGVFCCALYTVLTSRVVAGFNPVVLVALQQTAALVWALSIWPVEWFQGETAMFTLIPPSTWLWALVSGVVYYALAFWFYIIGLKKIPASLAGLFLNLIPIFAVGGAYLFLAERLATVQWAGAALILVAVMVMLRLRGTDTIPASASFEDEKPTGLGLPPKPAKYN